MSHGADSSKAVLYALAANFTIAVTKYAAAFFTGSSSMLAEAVHSTADCANQLLLLLGLKRSKRAPSSDYPLGFGKEPYFWSFLVALMLFSVGGVIILGARAAGSSLSLRSSALGTAALPAVLSNTHHAGDG